MQVSSYQSNYYNDNYSYLAKQAAIYLDLIQPAANSRACPGSKVLLTCVVTAVQHSTSITPFLIWEQLETQPSRVYYRNGMPTTAALGDFVTTAAFSNSNYAIMSNATLCSVSLLHHNKIISCFTPSSVNFLSETIEIAGKCCISIIIIMLLLYCMKVQKSLLLDSKSMSLQSHHYC